MPLHVVAIHIYHQVAVGCATHAEMCIRDRDYTYALDTLDDYDYQRLNIKKTTKEEPFHATYENAMHEINILRDKFGGSALFGNEKDESFKSSIGQIYQTFGGCLLYTSRCV